jgi:hypothetical protein
MKTAQKFDLMNSISWKSEFWSHEIQPPDPEPIKKYFFKLPKSYFLKLSSIYFSLTEIMKWADYKYALKTHF